LLIRFSYWLNVILLLVSGLTTFIAGLGANFEFDLKRIIVISILRHLGLMIPCVAGPCHHGMARPQVADRGTAPFMEGSC